MENPFKAIKKVAVAVLGSREDSTPFTQVSDFEELDLIKLNLSPEAKKELLAGINAANANQRLFEQVAAKKSQPVVQPRATVRAAQSQIPSKYKTVERTSIVKGETIRQEKDDKDDMEPERTLDPKY